MVAIQKSKLPKVSNRQLLNLSIGAIGLQFAWAMQINLTGRVTEPLGATPIILGLMWLAGPITGIIVQPIVGAISDNMWTRFGRRRPFLLIGAILGSLSLVCLPYSSSLLMAASVLWIIDICVNVSQGPHRALVPDIMPPEQHVLANSFFSFGVGVGAVIAFGFPFFLEKVLHYQISIKEQFIIAAVVCTAAMLWTCVTTPEKYKPDPELCCEKESPFESIRLFAISSLISGGILTVGVLLGLFGKFDLSDSSFIINILSWFVLLLSIPMLTMVLKTFYTKEIGKLCAMQYFTWIGMMCLFIYFNNFVVHNIYLIPDLSSAAEAVKQSYEPLVMQATNLSGIALAAFNLVCLIVSIPLGLLCNKYGKKNIHAIALFIMAIAYFGLAYLTHSAISAVIFAGLAGIGWASILTVPYTLLVDNAKEGTIASSLGKFNLFIAGPQILSSIAVGYLITKSPMQISTGMTNHWEYAFIAGGITIIIASFVALTLKSEKTAKVTDFKSIDIEDQSLTV
jgi:maltose/moltooligosaccharide transporter